MLDDYQDLIEELLGTPGVVREAGELDATGLQMIAALHARDAQTLDRVQRLVREPFPHLTILPSFEDTLAAASVPEDTEALMREFETTRGDLVSLLMNLTLKDWENSATYDAGGEISLVEEVENHVEFDEAFRARFQG